MKQGVLLRQVGNLFRSWQDGTSHDSFIMAFYDLRFALALTKHQKLLQRTPVHNSTSLTKGSVKLSEFPFPFISRGGGQVSTFDIICLIHKSPQLYPGYVQLGEPVSLFELQRGS